MDSPTTDQSASSSTPMAINSSNDEPFEGFPMFDTNNPATILACDLTNVNLTATAYDNPVNKRPRISSRNISRALAMNTNSAEMASTSSSATHVPDFDNSTEASRCNLCKEINPHKTPHMVKCDQCGLWCHFTCAGVSRRHVENRIWHCPKCLSPDNISELHNPANPVPSDIAKALANLKRKTRLYKRIPKHMRNHLAGILNERIENALNHPSKQSWWNLLIFAYNFLQIQKSQEDSQKPDSATAIQQSSCKTLSLVVCVRNLFGSDLHK